MKAELVAERTVDLAVGSVRVTLARHDDGHYSGVAALVRTGQRIGLLAAGPAVDGVVRVDQALVDETVAGPEVADELTQLLAATAASESAAPH
jgi:hypothetical protein